MCPRSADRGAPPRGPGHPRAAGQVLDAPGPQPRSPRARPPRRLRPPRPGSGGTPDTLLRLSSARPPGGLLRRTGAPPGPSALPPRPEVARTPLPAPALPVPRGAPAPGMAAARAPGGGGGDGAGGARAHDCSPSPPRAPPASAWAGERRQPPAARLPGRARRGRAGKSGSAAGVGARGTPQGPGFLFVRKIIIKTKPKQRAGLSRTFRRAAGRRLGEGRPDLRGRGDAGWRRRSGAVGTRFRRAQRGPGVGAGPGRLEPAHASPPARGS